MIQLHPSSGSFYVDLPHDSEQALLKAGWGYNKPKTKLFTDDPELIADFADLFSPELLAIMNEFIRTPLSITDDEWDDLIVEGESLFDHQKATVEFALGTGGGIHTVVGDPPGGGKTAINVTLANYLKPNLWLIVCPASVKFNWKLEIERFSTIKYDLIEVVDNKTRKEHSKNIRDLLKVNPYAKIAVIINYDILKNVRALLKEHIKRWDMITYDESHKLKNPKAKRTKFCLGGGNAIPLKGENIFFTSATKLNRPIDLWPVIRFCEPRRLGADKAEFIERYCGGEWNPFAATYDDKGASNIDELGYLLGQSFFIRHDIDHLLPPFREETIFLPESAAVKSAEQELFAEILASNDTDVSNMAKKAMAEARMRLHKRLVEMNLKGEEYDEDAEKIRIFGETFVEQSELLESIPVMFQMLSEIRKRTGIAKIPHLVAHIEEILDRDEDEPLVVMVHHKEVVHAIAEHFEDRYVKIVGGVSARKRQDAVEAFQAGKRQLFIGNIMAAGEGLTLTRSCRLLFGEIDWSATSMWQALKRVHRITQSREVTIEYLLLQNSLDANVAHRYIGKRENISEFFAGAEIARQERINVASQNDSSNG